MRCKCGWLNQITSIEPVSSWKMPFVIFLPWRVRIVLMLFRVPRTVFTSSSFKSMIFV